MSSTDDSELRSASIKFAAQVAAVVLVLFVMLGVIVYVVVSAGQSEAAKRALSDASMVDSVHDAPRDLLVTVIDQSGTQSSPDMPDGLPDEAALARVSAGGPPETATIRAGGQSYLTQTNVRRGKVVQVSYGLGEQSEELRRLLVALILSGIVAVLAAAAASVFVARRAMRPLAHALALQRRFVADASHELRTPLTLLSTRAQLLRRSLRDSPIPVDTAVSGGVDEIVDDSKALTEIVEDLLAVADPRRDAVADHVDLGSLCVAVAHAAQARSIEAGIQLDVEVVERAIVPGAAVSLRRMIVALIDNAIDHAVSQVRIDVTKDSHVVTIRVSDDGPGFEKDSQQRVFERFASSRSRPVSRAEPRHYGLGLALVAEVVARHRGTVTATNQGPNGGALVTVQLPTTGK